MNEILTQTTYFGLAISLFTYWVGTQVKKKWDYPFFHPLLISIVLISAVLIIFRIDFALYEKGAQYLSFFMVPATVCFAVPLYRQLQALKDNVAAVIISIICGCIVHLAVLFAIVLFVKMHPDLLLSLLSKSVTMPIALGITEEIGGITSITVLGVVGAGMIGAVLGPFLLKLFKINEPVAQGLAMGTASHAFGTSRAVEMGDVQAAMASLAIVVTGLLTVIFVPIAIKLFLV